MRIYNMERDIILKIATTVEEGKRIMDYKAAVFEVEGENTTISWNLAKDYNYENFPKEIARALKFALLGDLEHKDFMPDFKSF